MLYPVYVHKDENSAWGATVPDFPGCFSAADDWDQLPNAVREAVELHCEGEDMVIPSPGSVEIYAKDKRYRGGQWVFAEIETRKLNTRAVRLNISLPENLVNEIDSYVKSSGMTRSGFLAQAADKALHS